MVERHHQWMTQFGRSYKDVADKAHRFKIFKDNTDFIDTFNAAGNRSYTLAINDFANLTNEEFVLTRTGLKMGSRRNSSAFMHADVTEVPSSMDWRTVGAVTGVKDQGKCGCCWAFAAVAATESIKQLTTGNLVSLSEQELLDCDTSVNQGCNGGNRDLAYHCNPERPAPRAGKISGYEDVPANDEEALLKAVSKQPVSVSIDGSGSQFQFYKSGVFTGECATMTNHAVTIVGYGENSDGIKYWLVKNSWGTDWGEAGFGMIQRESGNVEGICSIAKRPSYPLA
ncbi:hypothetical protein SASPL_121453 [Salvia splendens]|uniref:KDEL-tailed cysteine endopeptidase n=1 Tax=Salvia splendens TaxID=180675 RepID=A0A8X8ZUS4_SALSN|nr:hypothetical protein SASPL_121453 [Salvia splendens]